MSCCMVKVSRALFDFMLIQMNLQILEIPHPNNY